MNNLELEFARMLVNRALDQNWNKITGEELEAIVKTLEILERLKR